VQNMTNRTCLILDFSKDLDKLLVMTIIQSKKMVLRAVKSIAVAMMMVVLSPRKRVQTNKQIFYFAEDLD
jgi:hypothetical protein